MPNWTANRICIKGDPIALRAFLEAVKGENGIFDFDNIISMPELLEHTGNIYPSAGKLIEAGYIITRDQKGHPEQVRQFTPDEEALLTAIGSRDRDTWRIANWGTKWNVSDPSLEDLKIESGSVTIQFYTPWTEPTPILFRHLNFQCEWQHGDEPDSHSHALTIKHKKRGKWQWEPSA